MIYSVKDIPEMLEIVSRETKKITKTRGDGGRERIEYYNIPCAFDIETSSFYNDGKKTAVMYEWTFGIDDQIVIGRTWKECIECFRAVARALGISRKKRLICGVHNLSFEFQFMRKWMKWLSVFALDDRKPVSALCEFGIEFRCTYILSGFSLEGVGKRLNRYKVEKAVGDLDYTKIRSAETPMTEKEIGYCVDDVRVVMAYLREKIEDDGDITKIPLTKTGYVRKYCRDACTKNTEDDKSRYQRYRNYMKALTLDVDEYDMLKRAFAGGFTHANAFFSGKTLEKVGSYDLTSAYPFA